MSDSVAGIVLAAGAGSRLAPLTSRRPKALCPVGNVPLVDGAIDRVRTVTTDVAVNVHHGREAMVDHLDGRVHLSIEEHEALGTAGAVGPLRDWIDGRPSVIVNADAWCQSGLDRLLDGWDGERIRILVPGDEPFGTQSKIAGSLLPWAIAKDISPEPAGLYEAVWQDALAAGELETIPFEGAFVDCGTPADYLAANLLASDGEPVVEPGAQVDGRLVRSVCWAEAVVEPSEVLVDAIRFSGRETVLVR